MTRRAVGLPAQRVVGFACITCVMTAIGCMSQPAPERVSEESSAICFPDQGCTCLPPDGALLSLYTTLDCTGPEYAYVSDEATLTWDGGGCLSAGTLQLNPGSYKVGFGEFVGNCVAINYPGNNLVHRVRRP